MSINKKLSYYLILFLILSTATGCSDNKYEEFAKEFDTIYFEIVSTLDLHDTYKSLEILQTKENKEKIDYLNVLLSDIQGAVPKNKQDYHLMLYRKYQGLVFLRDSFDRWEEFSKEEKLKLLGELSYISMRIIDKENEKSKQMFNIYNTINK